MNLGDGTGARRGFEESLAAFREQGDEHPRFLPRGVRAGAP